MLVRCSSTFFILLQPDLIIGRKCVTFEMDVRLEKIVI